MIRLATNCSCSKLSSNPGLHDGSPYTYFSFAEEGVNEDFVVPDRRRSLFGINPAPFVVPITVRVDGIALEPPEEFALSIQPVNPTAMDIFAEGIPGLFAFPEISVVIQDLESKKCC